MKIRVIKIFFLLSLVSVNFAMLSGQEKITPNIQIKYFKNTDNRRSLQTALTYSKNRMELPLAGMKIDFFTGPDKKTQLETGITNDKGIAEVILNDDFAIPAGKDGSWIFTSVYKGNDSIEASSSDISVTDVILEMNLALVDTIKTISLSANKISGGKKSPAGGETVIVYVPRMFNMLSIGEVVLDDSGSGSLEFPADLPGDKEGNVTIIAKFEDNPAFGNVEKIATMKWGVPSGYSVPSSHRALWTKGAPKWMIYTLSILLTGVWGHYLFAIISLIRIKLESIKEKKKERYEI